MMFLEGNFSDFENWGVVLDWTYVITLYSFFVFNHRLKIFGWDVLGGIATTY